MNYGLVNEKLEEMLAALEGRGLPIGTVRQWQAGRVRKTAGGWEPADTGSPPGPPHSATPSPAPTAAAPSPAPEPKRRPVAGDPTSFTPQEFESAAENFVAAMQKHAVDYMKKHHPTLEPYRIGVDKGPKYWRVWKETPGASLSKSVVGFIDKTTGFLLKADGWKKPAKGPRGDVFKDHPSKFGDSPGIH